MMMFLDVEMIGVNKDEFRFVSIILIIKVTGHSKLNFFVGFPPSVQDFLVK